MRILAATDIDLKAYEDCLNNSQRNTAYARPWYLDIVTRRRWSVLVKGDYEAVAPVPEQRNWLLRKVCFRPPFTQQLGWFGDTNEDDHLALAKFLGQYSKYTYPIPKSQLIASSPQRIRTNFVKPFDKEKQVFMASYNKSLRRRIRQSEHLELDTTTNTVAFLSYFWSTTGKLFSHNAKVRNILAEIVSTALSIDQGQIWLIRDRQDSSPLSMQFLLSDGTYTTNLAGGNSEQGKHAFSAHQLMHQILLHNPFDDQYFDFEGSDIPGVKNFFESFGPELDAYGEYSKI